MIPSYEQAIAELRAKHEFAQFNRGEAITPTLLRRRQEYVYTRLRMLACLRHLGFSSDPMQP